MCRPLYIWRSSPFFVVFIVLLSACAPEEDADETPDATPVLLERARLDTVVETERSIGRSEAFSAPIVAAQVDGQVEEIFHDIGDQVEAGTVLAKLDETDHQLELDAAQAEADALSAQLQLAERELERLQQVAEGEHVSESELEMARTEVAATREQLKSAQSRRDVAQRRLRKTEILAPIDGRIDERMISEGNFLAAGAEAFRMVPQRSGRVPLPFPERNANQLEVGFSARLRRLHEDDRWLDGEVTRLSPSVGDGTGVTAVIEFDPPEHWPAGALLEGLVEVDRRENAVLVPSESVVARPERQVIYVFPGESETGPVEEREVEVGYRTQELTEILEGVNADERVVVDGAQYLSDGTEVRVREGDR
ncbi:efflux RND transporter periplasmic adaptor subunit [Marinimicrobium sp. ABcell2]|uniref:efflux RND transporter periplasmic adaptor subunit n=1 Tax=Marinimicrobium sp. ABcell2 TaxID=3069751 RepID=UPI0027B58613|nr:efflux RND transporter periplasmic adaptor subunit [Marinimicrobium sp. ABcell2]MDQ2077876.1 efflux RND transporter periplasmic adaptor subunit [Marinimicrobium sp. ABcell2]